MITAYEVSKNPGAVHAAPVPVEHRTQYRGRLQTFEAIGLSIAFSVDEVTVEGDFAYALTRSEGTHLPVHGFLGHLIGAGCPCGGGIHDRLSGGNERA